MDNTSGYGAIDLDMVGSLQLRAYEHVKARIMKRELRPGQTVTDSQIAAELSISRTPVRDALRRLALEGFLEAGETRGWKVYSLSLNDIHEIFDIKVELEGMMARKASTCSDKQLRAKLSSCVEDMNNASHRDNHEAWREADTALHGVISVMSGNERAARMVRDLNDQWYRVRIGLLAMKGRIQKSNREHELFVQSILNGEADEAERHMKSHLNNLRRELVNVLENLVLPFAQNGV